jgi:hypothetical protein
MAQKEERRPFATMNIHTTTLACKPIDEAGERELLIHSLRTAVARSRLVTNTLETIGVSLRHKQVSTAEAMNWLHDEGLLSEVQIPLPRAPEAANG